MAGITNKLNIAPQTNFIDPPSKWLTNLSSLISQKTPSAAPQRVNNPLDSHATHGASRHEPHQYSPSHSIHRDLDRIKDGTAYANLAPRSEVKNNAIQAAIRLLPADMQPHMTAYTKPLRDLDGSLLYPQMKAGADLGELLDRHIETQPTPGSKQPSHAQDIARQIFGEGSTQLPWRIVDGEQPIRTLKIMKDNLLNGGDAPTQSAFTTTRENAKTLQLLTHLAAQDPQASFLLKQNTAPYLTIVQGMFPKNGPDSNATQSIGVRADNKAMAEFDPAFEWKDQGYLDRNLTLAPGHTLVEIPLPRDLNVSFSSLLGKTGAALPSEFVNRFVNAMQTSRAANTTGRIEVDPKQALLK